MYNIDSLTLISGIDIPIVEYGVNIHQPTIREIAYIGEESFFKSAEILTITTEKFLLMVENISEEDKKVLSNLSNFEVFLKLLNMDDSLRVSTTSLLAILFPYATVDIEERFILLSCQKTQKVVIINETNFEILQDIITVLLCLKSGKNKEEFNPSGDRAREIAEKIKRGREKAARSKGEHLEKGGFLSKYISGLGIATQANNIRQILDLTLYQFIDQLQRYELYTLHDMCMKSRLAGAKDVEEVDWLKDIEH